MKRQAWIVVCALVLASSAEARLGETVEECQRRYGAAVTNYPGHGNVDTVAVYVKDGICVVAIFTKRAGVDTRASMVIYSRLHPDARGLLAPPPEITEKEQAALLDTVSGRWKDYDDTPPRLAARPSKVVPLLPQPTITVRHRDATAEALNKAVEALYAPPALSWIRTPPKNIAHNGPKLFAFRILRGVAICSQDGAEAVRAWAERVISETAAARKPPEGKLSGF
ncbi:MAG: hypothetical protein FJ224_08355 [Lentisphaerae bacterium]|nr:hypothetical protein [Lentisphaerota bacterium]